MFLKIFEYIKLFTKFDSDFIHFIFMIIFSSIFIVIKNIFLLILLKNSELNLINFLIILTIFIAEQYLCYKKDNIKIKCIKKYSQSQIIDINNILNNTDLNILNKMNKSNIIGPLSYLYPFHSAMFNYIIEITTIIMSLSIILFYYLFLGNFQIMISIILVCILTHLNMSNLNNVKNKLQIQYYDYKIINTKINQFYQDIFNTAVNLDITNINNFNSEFISSIKDDLDERMFDEIFDFINKILIISFFFCFYFIIQNNGISTLEFLVIAKYIMYTLEELIFSKKRINGYKNYLYDLLDIYNLKQRKCYNQFHIEHTSDIILNKFNINTSFINLQLDKPIILKPNKLYLIVGPSGCGKTTFVKTLRCINNIDPMNIELFVSDHKSKNKSKKKYDLNNISSNIYYVDQSTKLFRNGNIYEIINGFNTLYKNQKSNEIIDDLINICELDHFKSDIESIQIANVSGGEMYRISICKTLFLSKMNNKKLIIMDEIDAALDINTTKKILEYIKETLHGSTILYISHKECIQDMGFPIIRICNGKISLEE